jgi:Ca-activated chloride channel homolog
MNTLAAYIIFHLIFMSSLFGQSGRVKNYSESFPRFQEVSKEEKEAGEKAKKADADAIVINTEFVLIPVQITDRKGKPVMDIRREEFKVFENGIEQEIEYFSNTEQPFTVALVLDMSYSSVFKLAEIQKAAKIFIEQLRPDDKVMVISFDKEIRILCEPTNNKKVLRLAIEATKIASGTSLYSALDLVINNKFKEISGKKAIVLFSDGVDTSNQNIAAKTITNSILSSDIVFYSIRYNTYDDVQKNRKKDAQILFDENDRPYVVERPRKRGEKETDYKDAAEFLKTVSEESGGRVYNVSSATNLHKSLGDITNELRRIYSLGYYPKHDQLKKNTNYINVRIYRPNLRLRTKKIYKTQ